MCHRYWPLVMNISRKFTVSRVKRCAQVEHLSHDAVCDTHDSNLVTQSTDYGAKGGGYHACCANFVSLHAMRGYLLLEGKKKRFSERRLEEIHSLCFSLSDSCSQADICQLGLDQRKVNMLAREYCDVIKKYERKGTVW